ncbi:MBL fold metallo-hydrolase [Pseudomonas sp. S60]|uniref:MBL fold metallo-hydrolase RNA specificity domain-containing protein n=1 Tax=Pseudomonas sp. S60 TaxID=211124 RepID=UPI0019113065|nr:MBL fold metallo-hydrolase [Pseudomonas sp. S60]MBK5012054.1 MBL fold metallo-hydrolase [Pseudomonas sp. S60]
MEFPSLSHHGAVRGVTGSCHQLHLATGVSLLVDCGLEQGADAIPQADAAALTFDINSVCALIITHVHLDHVGRIPALLAAGYRGPILCSEPSAQLLPLVLEDAYRLAISSDPAHVSRYLELVSTLLVPLPFEQWHPVLEQPDISCRVRLQRAGHLLGSAYVECDIQYGQASRRYVFSGDLGAGNNPLLRPLQPPGRADVLVLESTYGDRLNPHPSHRVHRLEAAIDRALADQGTILIPAFSLGRTQELLYELEDVLYRKALLGREGGSPDGEPVDWSQLPIILDSPLAQRITAVYRELHAFWNEEARARRAAGRDPLAFGQLICVDTHARHQQVVNYLKSTGRPAIVIAGNGMCSGGRIVNYLKAMLGDRRHEVMFVGYQARGTPGAVIQALEGSNGVGQVDLDGERHEVKAKVTTLRGYSGHADQAGLVAFATGLSVKSEEVVLVHGEAQAKNQLARVLRQRLLALGRPTKVKIAT